jgi:hypothetical protein
LVTSSTEVADFYRKRLEEARASTAALEARARRFSNLRLAAFLVLLAVTGFALWSDYAGSIAGLGVALAILVGTIVGHERVLRRVVEARRVEQFCRDCVDRVENRWKGKGISGGRFRDSHHAYSEDLDLFGSGSLFELLCSARTAAGEAQLARWLMEPAEPGEAMERQQAVRELIPDVGLREDLALLGPDVQAEVHPEALVRWGTGEPHPFSAGERAAARILPALTILAAVATFGFGLPYSVFGLAALLQILFALRLRQRVDAALQHVDFATRDLAILALVLRRFEAGMFEATLLRRLRAQLESGGPPPSARIAKLSRLGELLDSRLNQAFAVIAPVLLWSTNCAIAIERWRTENGSQLASWLQAVGELEALCSLARYAFEHPTDVWPQFHEGPPLLDAREIAHPLLSEAVAIRNSVVLSAERPLLIVSGSNMSGKSTLLRAIGTNVVLAQAGAPVRAGRFVLSPFRVGASIRVEDNLKEGESRFYAEIRQIRDILEMARKNPPVLFLLDEIFSGTNSHDRRIGAQAILRSLVERGALGLVTTHDLALTRMEEELGDRARNVHFEDQIVDGRMQFDYRMREGVVTRSNALELMRSIGIEL